MSTRVKTIIISIPLLIISGLLVSFFFRSIKHEINTKEQIKQIEESIVNRMKLLRDLQNTYKSKYGRYARWKELKEFAKNGKFYVIEKRQKYQLQDNGQEKITTIIDTLRTANGEFKTISVRDSVLKNHSVKLNVLAYKGVDKENIKIELLETKFKAQGEDFKIKFEMETDTLESESSAFKIPVIEVRANNPKVKKSESEIKFGSLSDPSTSGNWESLGN